MLQKSILALQDEGYNTEEDVNMTQGKDTPTFRMHTKNVRGKAQTTKAANAKAVAAQAVYKHNPQPLETDPDDADERMRQVRNFFNDQTGDDEEKEGENNEDATATEEEEGQGEENAKKEEKRKVLIPNEKKAGKKKK